MNKSTSQLKREAKDRLRGRWGDAVLLNLVPTLLQIGGLVLVGFLILFVFFWTSSIFGGMSLSNFFYRYFTGDSFNYMISFNYSRPIFSLLISYIQIGISFTFLDVIRKGQKQKIQFRDAFRVFNGIDFIPILIINILIALFTFFWSLLFIIPGIVKKYAYSQANFIFKDLATHEDTSRISATHIITESRSLMNGNKGRLFWLDITFIGWYIVGICTFGIGFLWINPYIKCTKAAFYADLAKDKFLRANLVFENEQEWTSF